VTVRITFKIPENVSFESTVEGSSSWRIPLGVQLIPGIVLAVGCFFLPPSPRLLVLHGKHEEALSSLAKLRLRTPEEMDGDSLLQVRCFVLYAALKS